ncbi:MAG: S8 family serine peptidase [Verrucomicrobia bacterium]|nr:S8 family serine peptidase [Verrucomicrobiota bacterium]
MNTRTLKLAVSAALALNAPFTGFAQQADQTAADVAANLANPVAAAPDEFVPDEVLVAFRPGFAAPRAEAVRRALGATRLQVFSDLGVHHWRLPPGLGVANAVQALSANPNVLYAEPNYLVHALAIPNDPLRGDLWGLHNLGQTGGTADADIDGPEAWNVRTDASTVVVGVIDTGIDYTHEDLAANIWTNPGESGGGKETNGLDDDGNGYIDDFRGWDFVNEDNDPFDDAFHGTHVAGTIGAVGDNSKGVVGVAWKVQLMPLKFLNAGGSGTTTDAIEAINYAKGKGVKITSNSWGGGQKSRALEDAIKNSGALFVAAAGNGATSTKMYPAGFSQPNIIAVAATDHNDALASFSNFGTWVHLAAPGVSVLSSTPGNNYRFLNGTSMATPHVSGVAALVMAQNPGFTVANTKAQILNNVDVLAALAGKTSTSGRLNARKALGGAELPPDGVIPSAVADLASPSSDPVSVTLTWTAPGDDGSGGTAYAYDVRYRTDGPVTEANWATATPATGEPNPQPAGAAETFIVEGLAPQTTYYFALKSLDEAGNTSPISNSASATTLSTGWSIFTPDTGQNMATYIGLDFDSGGNPAIAYDDYTNGQLKFAHFDGAAWTIEVVAAGGGGASLAYDPSGLASVSHVASGKLYFASKSGPAWTSTVIERSNVQGDNTSLAYDSLGNSAISYRRFSGQSGNLKLARRSGGVWTTQTVEAGAGARYNQLAFDAAGNPAIAYSDDINADGWLDTLKFAHWNGASWDIWIVDTGLVGYGVFATVAYDPTTGYPAVAHRGTGQLRFFRWDGAGWAGPETVDPSTTSISGTSLAFASDGTAYLAYGTSETRVAQRNPISGVWTVHVVDPSAPGSFMLSAKVGPDGRPAVGYDGPPVGSAADSVRVAWKEAP